jgi:regulator of cell morphogenesis and NO signaling
MADISQQTLASIVTDNHHTVSVLEKYHLDFCCRGKRKLTEACDEIGIEVETILQELKDVAAAGKIKSMPFAEMTAEELISHILTRHHFYVKQSMPVIYMHLEKVAQKHGERFPYMIQVFDLFAEIQEEMTAHMQKEELILFPRIKETEKIFLGGGNREPHAHFINAPIAVMENEHEHAGAIMSRIRTLTNDYTAPDSACTTFRISLKELKEFEADLHEHVHLENNILFPKAQSMVA